MVKIIIGENDKDQRLDRFLRKHFNKAPLSLIYKMIRKDVKVNGKRGKEDTLLKAGDEVSVYITDKEAASLRKVFKAPKVKKQFVVAYEDDDVIIVGKPFGLLTHGNEHEKKNTLVNQVIDYLIEKGDYVPKQEKSFSPACVNRLDRNTTGLVIFGKNAKAVREYNRLIGDKEALGKYYKTIVDGKIDNPVMLSGEMVKDHKANRAILTKGVGKTMETQVVPLKCNKGYTLVEVRLLTGRTHQIRMQLAEIGHPIIGDPKYGNPQVNDRVRRTYGLNTQLLHCHKLIFYRGGLEGKTIVCPLPEQFEKIKKLVF